jgi:hypothetical protein
LHGKEDPKVNMSAAARKALMDTESRKRDDDNYNPVMDILFGGIGKKPEPKSKDDEKLDRESKIELREKRNSQKHGKRTNPDPILEEISEEPTAPTPVVVTELSMPTTGTSIAPTLGATGTADPISHQKQASLRRRGSVCLVDKQIAKQEDNLDMPSFGGNRRLSTSTPGLMLRRPTLEADNTSRTKLNDLNNTINTIKQRNSTCNLIKEQKGRDTIITERISKLNLQGQVSGISFGLQRESTATIPDILPLLNNDELKNDMAKYKVIEENYTDQNSDGDSSEAKPSPRRKSVNAETSDSEGREVGAPRKSKSGRNIGRNSTSVSKSEFSATARASFSGGRRSGISMEGGAMPQIETGPQKDSSLPGSLIGVNPNAVVPTRPSIGPMPRPSIQARKSLSNGRKSRVRSVTIKADNSDSGVKFAPEFRGPEPVKVLQLVFE